MSFIIFKDEDDESLVKIAEETDFSAELDDDGNPLEKEDESEDDDGTESE